MGKLSLFSEDRNFALRLSLGAESACRLGSLGLFSGLWLRTAALVPFGTPRQRSRRATPTSIVGGRFHPSTLNSLYLGMFFEKYSSLGRPRRCPHGPKSQERRKFSEIAS